MRAALVACGAWLAFAPVHAQVSGSVGVVTDYRYRGYSLSAGDPALQASIAYDAASGVYGGLFASTTREEEGTGSQWIPYAGIARRDGAGRSWDVGVRYVHFTGEGTYLPPAYGEPAVSYDYLEAHVGVAFRRAAVRLHLAPDYYGAVPHAYLETDAHFTLGERVFGDRLQLLLHGGLSQSGNTTQTVFIQTSRYGVPSGYHARREGDRRRFDFSAGLALRTSLCDVQATWHHLGGSAMTAYAVPWDLYDRSGFVLGCTKRW